MKLFCLPALLGVAAILSTSSVAFAQFGHSPANTEVVTRQDVLIEIKNVPSNLMAYWLDPAHNLRPAELGALDKAENKGALELPAGIERILAVGTHNEIQVTGFQDENFRQLVKLIDVLDQPLRQIEIEAQFVEMSADDANGFPIDFPAAPDNTEKKTDGLAPRVGLVRVPCTARLNALVANNRAKVFSAPRAKVFNNFRADLTLAEKRGIRLTSVAGGDPNRSNSFSLPAIRMEVVPTINGDDSISLHLKIASVSSTDTGGIEAVANSRDGDTVVITGLTPPPEPKTIPLLKDIPIITGLFRSKTKFDTADNSVVIFLTPRIIRPAADETAPPEE